MSQDRPPQPKQCEALRGKDRCPNEARCFWEEMGRWVCLTHILSASTHIRFIERPPEPPTP